MTEVRDQRSFVSNNRSEIKVIFTNQINDAAL